MRLFLALAALVLVAAAAPRAAAAQPASGACTIEDAVVRADVWIECVDWKSATRAGDVVSFWTTTVARPGQEWTFRRAEADGRRREGMSTKGYHRYARKALFFEMRCEARRMRITKGRA